MDKSSPTQSQQPSGARTGITLTQYAILVAAGAFATTFAQQRVLAGLPTTFLLKEHFHLKKEDVAFFYFWATFAWNLKPLAGILTDAFPLLGTRRRSYMILGAGLAGILWVLMGFFSDALMPLLIVSIGMNVATVFASTVMGGLMVEAGQAFGTSGRISSLRQFVQSVAGIGAPLIGGYLAGKAFGWKATTTIAAITVFALALLTFFLLKEKKAVALVETVADSDRPQYRPSPGIIFGLIAGASFSTWLFEMTQTRNIGISLYALLLMFLLILAIIMVPTRNIVVHKAQGQLIQILQSRTLWMAVTMLFLVYTVPGFGTALTYRQSDLLKFDKSFIGLMGSLEGAAGVVGAIGYGLFCRKLNLRLLLVGSIAANAALTLLYLIYNGTTAPPIHIAGGLVGVLSELALMDLAVRSTPPGCEALGFSLMMSVRNFGIALSDVLGSKMLDDFHFSFESLVVINAATTLAVLIFVPFLPKLVMNRKEGETGNEEPRALATPDKADL
jgi:predicted MFS family arabinose efflux permease